MGSMVEAVARALAVEAGAGEASWLAFADDARAAIGAMVSPTVTMIGAGAVAGAVSNDAAAAVWGAMIEAASR